LAESKYAANNKRIEKVPNNQALKYAKKASIINDQGFLSATADSATPVIVLMSDFS